MMTMTRANQEECYSYYYIERSVVYNFPHTYIYNSCGNRAQLATVWSTGGTCTVCGHPTMSNYFTMYYYKIVGVAVLPSLPAITATSYYLSEVHMYCLWPLPHILLVCPFSVDPY